MFALLQQNAAHLWQPLHIYFFANKKLSRTILQEWKRHCNGGKFQQFFLSLLKRLVIGQFTIWIN